MAGYFVIGILLCFSVRTADPVAIENEIVGEPEIDCSSTGLSLKLRTRNPFLGRIFVKGEAENPECTTEDDRTNQYSPVKPFFELNFDRCGMYRLRMLNPRGMMYSTIVIVSFHPIFITKVDRAYNIKCFYGEISKTVTAALNVSMIPTTDLHENMQMPQCSYTIRRDNIEGPEILFGRVGDKVVHRWDCDTNEMYRFLVKDCYVKNGRNSDIEVIDSRGCSVDPVLLTDVIYDPEFPVAYAESHVFKFADVSQLYFQCQIEVCLTVDGNCDRLTPPSCGVAKRKLRFKRLASGAPNKTIAHFKRDFENTMDVISKDVTILGIEQSLEGLEKEIHHEEETAEDISDTSEECIVGVVGFAVVVTILGGSSLLFAVAVCILYRRSKYFPCDDSSAVISIASSVK